MEVAGRSPASVAFSCDAETFALLAYGRIKPEVAISNTSLTYQRDHTWAVGVLDGRLNSYFKTRNR